MAKLPPLSSRQVVKALSKAGFEVVGRKGSHVRLKKRTPTKTYIVIVPMHPEIKKETLKSIIRQSGLSPEELLKILKQ
jgi:predicted RNA binding protein YcfA (HicA-like mRNA interferase family)